MRNCDNVQCSIPICDSDERLFVREGECCPVCTKTFIIDIVPCPRVPCAVDGQCEPGQELIIPELPCCAYCEDIPEPNCTLVDCEFPLDCGLIGGHIEVPEGECCPRCVGATDPCFGILCVAPFCLTGQVDIVPKGECCPQCVSIEEVCSTIECAPGQECEIILRQPQCVPVQQVNPCAVTLCKEGTFCENIGGRGVCTPFPECRRPCEHGTVCQFIGGNAVCVSLATRLSV